MSEHEWGDTKDGLRACRRGGCTILFDPILGLWKWSRTLRWKSIKRGQIIPPCRGRRAQNPDRCTHVERAPLALNPGHSVVGGIKVCQCERDALPRMVVCEHHATPDAIRLVVLAMDAEIQHFKQLSDTTPDNPSEPAA